MKLFTMRVSFEFRNYAHTVPVDPLISMRIMRKKILRLWFLHFLCVYWNVHSLEKTVTKKVTQLQCIILNVLCPRIQITVQIVWGFTAQHIKRKFKCKMSIRSSVSLVSVCRCKIFTLHFSQLRTLRWFNIHR